MSQVNGVAAQMPERIPMVPIPFAKENALITSILQSLEFDPGLRLIEVEVSLPCKAGDNYLSTIKKAKIVAQKSDGKHFRKSFILKVPLSDSNTREAMDIDSIWASEEFMYKTFFPAMKIASNYTLPIPGFFYSDASVMVLDNLLEKEFVMKNRLVGLSYDHCMLVFDRLAHFHASSVTLHCKNPEFFNNYKTNFVHTYLTQETRNKTYGFIQKNLLDAITTLKSAPGWEPLRNAMKFLNDIVNDITRLVPILQMSPSGKTCVLIHGDLWLNNIMFKEDPSNGKPFDVRFLDFQGSRLGSAAVDIYHFLYTSVVPSVRKEHFNNFIIFYHKCLMVYLKEMIEPKDRSFIDSFSFEKLLDEMKFYRLYGLINSLLMLPTITLDAESQTFGFFDSTSRPLAANQNVDDSMSLRSRYIDVMEEYDQRGWLEMNI